MKILESDSPDSDSINWTRALRKITDINLISPIWCLLSPQTNLQQQLFLIKHKTHSLIQFLTKNNRHL